MNTTAFTSPQVNHHYLKLLRFCRSQADVEDAISQSLDAIPESALPIQSLLPLIFHNAIKHNLPEALSPRTQNTIKQGALVMVAREMAYQNWLSTHIELFSQENIPIILLKGAAFSNDIYTPEAPRPGVDVDFLVREADFDKVCGVLEGTMEPVLLDENRAATHQMLFERMFKPADKPFPVVEVHRGLTNPYIFSIDEAKLWQASQPHPAHGSEYVRILSPEDTLLHLATHAFRDLDFCTHSLLDVYKLYRQKPIDPELLLHRARQWGACNVLYCLLYNARTIMDAPVADELLQSLNPGERKLKRFKTILQSKALAQKEKSPEYRRLQIKAQLVFPDRISNALRFQAHYGLTRLKDLVAR